MPLYAGIMFALLGGIFMLCVLPLRRFNRAGALPLFPTDGMGSGLFNAPFPNRNDIAYTVVILLLFMSAQAAVIWKGLQPQPAAEGQMAGITALLFNLGLEIVLYLPALIRCARLPHMVGYKRLGLFRGAGLVVLSLLLILLPAAGLEQAGLYTWLNATTGCPEQQEVVSELMESSVSEQLLLIFAAVVMAPICEEAFFRGFLFNILRHCCGCVLPAALMAGLAFGVIHGSLAQMLPLTIFGFVQCLIYARCRTLCVPMAVHAVFNGLAVLNMLLAPELQALLEQYGQMPS